MFKYKHEAHEWIKSTRGITWTGSYHLDFPKYLYRYCGKEMKVWCDSDETYRLLISACIRLGGLGKQSNYEAMGREFQREADGQLLMF